MKDKREEIDINRRFVKISKWDYENIKNIYSDYSLIFEIPDNFWSDFCKIMKVKIEDKTNEVDIPKIFDCIIYFLENHFKKCIEK